MVGQASSGPNMTVRNAQGERDPASMVRSQNCKSFECLGIQDGSNMSPVDRQPGSGSGMLHRQIQLHRQQSGIMRKRDLQSTSAAPKHYQRLPRYSRHWCQLSSHRITVRLLRTPAGQISQIAMLHCRCSRRRTPNADVAPPDAAVYLLSGTEPLCQP